MPSDKISKLLLQEKEKPKSDTSELSMSGAQPVDDLPPAIPAPPPFQPVAASSDPYDFITNPNSVAKKSLLPGAKSKTGRIIIAAVGAMGLILVAMIGFSIISKTTHKLGSDYTSLMQQQTELIRISNIGVTTSNQSEARNLAITAQYSLTTQRSSLLGIAQKAGAKVDVKTQALGKDAHTDAQLKTADQTNQFDPTFIKIMHTNLQKYQTTLKKIYDSTANKATKQLLAKDYTEIGNLIGKKESPTTTP